VQEDIGTLEDEELFDPEQSQQYSQSSQPQEQESIPSNPEVPGERPLLMNKIRFDQNSFIGGSLAFVNDCFADWNSTALVEHIEPSHAHYSFELEIQRYLDKSAAYIFIAVSDSIFFEGTLPVGTTIKIVVNPQNRKRQVFVNNVISNEDYFVVSAEGAMVQVSTWSQSALRLKTSKSA